MSERINPFLVYDLCCLYHDDHLYGDHCYVVAFQHTLQVLAISALRDTLSLRVLGSEAYIFDIELRHPYLPHR